MHSKIHVSPHPGNDDDWSPVPIVARIVHKGELHRHVKAAHHVRVVISLADLFATVVQAPIAEDESQAAKGQVFPVFIANAASFKGAPDLVFFSAPRISGEFEAERQGAVHLRICERLVVAFIPSGAHKDAEVGG